MLLDNESYPCPEFTAGESLKRELYEQFSLYFLLLDIILIVPTVCGNGLVILAVAYFRTLRESTAFMLVGNLAVSDLLVGLVQMPMDIAVMKWPWASSNKTFCLWHNCLSNAFLGASVMNLLLISIERFYAIKYPLKHNVGFTRRLTLRLVGVSWFFIFVVSLVPVVGWYNKERELGFVCKTDDIFMPAYRIVFGTTLVVSLLVNFFLYIVVVYITLKKRKAFLRRSEISQRRMKKDFHYTKLMLLVSGLFGICWGPYCVLSLFYLYSDAISFLRCLFSSFGLINSGLNWLIYGVRNVKIRKALYRIVTCRCFQQQQLLKVTGSRHSTRMSELM